MSASYSFAEAALFFRPAELPGRRSVPLRPVTTPADDAASDSRIDELRQQLGADASRMLSTGTDLVDAAARRERALRTTQIPVVDELIGGFERGTLTEINGWRSAGRFSIVLATIAAITSCGEPVALIDRGNHLDPQNAAAAGVDLARLLWIRPDSVRDAAAVAEMTINAGFSLVVVDLGLSIKRDTKSRRLPDATWIRLTRRAAEHGATLLVSAPFHTSGTSASTVMTVRSPKPVWIGNGRSPRLLAGITAPLVLEKHRKLRSGKRTSLVTQVEDAVETRDVDGGRCAVGSSEVADRQSSVASRQSPVARKHNDVVQSGSSRTAQPSPAHRPRPTAHAPLTDDRRLATDDSTAHRPRPTAHAFRNR